MRVNLKFLSRLSVYFQLIPENPLLISYASYAYYPTRPVARYTRVVTLL